MTARLTTNACKVEVKCIGLDTICIPWDRDKNRGTVPSRLLPILDKSAF